MENIIWGVYTTTLSSYYFFVVGKVFDEFIIPIYNFLKGGATDIVYQALKSTIPLPYIDRTRFNSYLNFGFMTRVVSSNIIGQVNWLISQLISNLSIINFLNGVNEFLIAIQHIIDISEATSNGRYLTYIKKNSSELTSSAT